MKPTTSDNSGRGNGHYGCDELGRLRRVLLHRPGQALELINGGNFRQWQFDSVPDIERFSEEHDRYRQLLQSHGVEALELADYVSRNAHFIPRLPNLTYMHDIAVVSRKGAMLSRMINSRCGEEQVVREAMSRLGIPIVSEFDDNDGFEGCLLLGPETLLVAETERHYRHSVEKFIHRALEHFQEVIQVDAPKARRFMHADTVFGRIRKDLALAYLPAMRDARLHTREGTVPIDCESFMRSRGIEIIPVSDSEQARLACSFVPLEPGVIFHYDTALDKATKLKLARRNVELILFHPQAMVAGGGSLRCLTLRLWRTLQ